MNKCVPRPKAERAQLLVAQDRHSQSRSPFPSSSGSRAKLLRLNPSVVVRKFAGDQFADTQIAKLYDQHRRGAYSGEVPAPQQ
jgi:hypothetical protein